MMQSQSDKIIDGEVKTIDIVDNAITTEKNIRRRSQNHRYSR